MSEQAERQVKLPFRKALQISWKNIRVRWWRSMLVTSGIILALAFLTYVLSSDALSQQVARDLPDQLNAAEQRGEAAAGELRDAIGTTRHSALRPIRQALTPGDADKINLDKLHEALAAYPDALAALAQAKGDGQAAGVPPELTALQPAIDRAAGVVADYADYAAFHESLEKAGFFDMADDEEAQADARSQTYWIVGLALLVSFVGILNAMLMSVTERFAEIGTMKCLGAMDGFIIKLFMLESTFQGISGALLGVLVGLLLAVVEGFIMFGHPGRLAGMLPWLSFVKIVAVCMLAGTVLTIIAALYPAWRAAKMQPVEAMRAEV